MAQSSFSMHPKHTLAASNFKALSRNPYPGRGIVLGLNSKGDHLVQIYWIMGRSENSRNRVFESADGRLFTVAADPSKVKDPSLIIYNAMLEANGVYIVSNGAQTDDVYRSVRRGGDFEHGLRRQTYEPDSPNFTPRITGALELDSAKIAKISILRKSPWDDTCETHLHTYVSLGKGFGYCVTTYQGDGDPLPSFQGEPILLPLEGTMDQIAKKYWAALNPENRVSLAVKFIKIESGESSIKTINRFTKVS